MTTAAQPTGTFVGKCGTCGRRYYAANQGERAGVWCECRKDVPCERNAWGFPKCGLPECAGHPQTSIKWSAVKGQTSSKRCALDCEHAQSDRCVCECGGRNHGRGHALDLAGVA